MQTARRTLLLLAFSFAVIWLPAVAQVVTATVPVGGQPFAVAVDQVTNKIYVVNTCGNDSTCSSHYGTVTVIDGRTLSTDTVAVGIFPESVAVNPVTNKIYVVNNCGDPACQNYNETVTAINGANRSTVAVSGMENMYDGGQGQFSTVAGNTVAVNPETNKIYAVVPCGNDSTCNSPGRVAVINGGTNSVIATPMVGRFPYAVAVNRVTNKIYVVNFGDSTVSVIDGSNDTVCCTVNASGGAINLAINEQTNQIYVVGVSGYVAVIDANHNNMTTFVGVGEIPFGGIAVNPVTNRAYVSDYLGGTVTVIDGNTFYDTVYVGGNPFEVAVNPVTNQIYVVNNGYVTVIDGATDTVCCAVSAGPFAVAVNSVANTIYVANEGGNDVSVIAGANATALQFVPVTPCRVVDTRNTNGEFGGPPIAGQTSRSFSIPQGTCGIPAAAAAYSLNVTLVPIQNGPVGYLTIWPTGEEQPVASTMNSLDARIKANAAIVPAGYQGAASVYVTNTTNVVLDIDGYFTTPGANTLQFYPLTPCRVLDTRPQSGGNGPLPGGMEYDFPVLGIPAAQPCIYPSANPVAYSFNFTVVPVQLGQPLGYLTVWPEGTGQRPVVSTLNNLTGTVVANAAIVPAGKGGEIATYPSNDTNLVVDIDGYFAPAGVGGMSLYPAAPCRVLDTRQIGNGQPFSGTLSPPISVVNSACGVPSTAGGYVFNATVVPVGPLGYLTLWPDGQNQPLASTLNAVDGAITSNMAILQNFDGESNAYASGITQLILDISSYFAP